MLELCQIYGWTWNDLDSQPEWFIELAIQKLIIDRKNQNAAAG